jgi:hypothetical protein
MTFFKDILRCRAIDDGRGIAGGAGVEDHDEAVSVGFEFCGVEGAPEADGTSAFSSIKNAL